VSESTAHVSAVAVGRVGKRPEPLVDLLAEVGERALEAVGRKTVEGLIVGNMAAGSLARTENLVGRLADRLGLDTASGHRAEAASASGAAAFHAAVAHVVAGHATRALVLAGEKMTELPTGEVSGILARSLSPLEEASGATMLALAALVAQRYLVRHGLDESVLHAVSVQARANAANNENAQFRSPISVQEVAASRPVAIPLRLLHCSAISDGAVALVVERGEGAAGVLGLGQGFDHLQLADRPDLTTFRATRSAAQRAYEMAHLTRKEVAFAELHDAFAPFALIDLEDIGACGPGEAGEWFRTGATARDGRFPVNVSGGLLGRGHPVGASGLFQIAEVARQLRGEAGAMQLDLPPGAVGLAQSIGGLASHNFVTLLGGASPARGS
jgi:acetyl-CoA C-acetyltransferase